jgi:hypothetical protein
MFRVFLLYILVLKTGIRTNFLKAYWYMVKIFSKRQAFMNEFLSYINYSKELLIHWFLIITLFSRLITGESSSIRFGNSCPGKNIKDEKI